MGKNVEPPGVEFKDHTGTLCLRVFSISLPSQKTIKKPGKRVRCFGEIAEQFRV